MATFGHDEKTPVLLLKTKSSPADGYEELVTTVEQGAYEPIFVPVLEHRFKQSSLSHVRHLIETGCFSQASGKEEILKQYGAIIFTSQRAVEAFASIITDIRRDQSCDLRESLSTQTPLYVVGPATARGLRALDLTCPILGEESGNGETLAAFMLEHYNSQFSSGPEDEKPSILFLVGDKRRDIIPKTLQSSNLPIDKRIQVDELEVYETGEMQSFKSNFASLCKENIKGTKDRNQWVVVFSPTGCKAMLEVLGLIDPQTGRVSRQEDSQRKTRIATIGPTTRDYLINEFGFRPDACAETPSPEGIMKAITEFLDSRKAP